MHKVTIPVSDDTVAMKEVSINGESFYKITNVDSMRPFFMSLVSDSDHWMFIASNGGLTAGRKNNGYALFPYYTDDKVTESSEITGSKTIFKVACKGKDSIWEPFSEKYTGVYKYSRNLYKNRYGNKLIFEEINHDLELTYQCHWNSSDKYGFVKKSSLVNNSGNKVSVKLLDGVQNIMPFGIEPSLQQSASNLADAYKKNELIKKTGLGIYTLSAIIVDKAEPSEALKANVVWSLGITKPKYLLSSLQLDVFRENIEVAQEEDIRAEKGAYFIVSEINLNKKDSKDWFFIADVNKGASEVINLSENIQNAMKLEADILEDIELGTRNLKALTTAADGSQITQDQRRNVRHYANVLFNIMRGGIFDDNYNIEKEDFVAYVQKANNKVFAANASRLSKLDTVFDLKTIKKVASKSKDKDFYRLSIEYLPLKFSRRHGDPSRPWNKFSINTKNELDGSKILDYQGNWRDIFQNWEALAYSYPEFMEGMIHKFLNATTFDGYNPYRVTKGGFDWEVIEPDDPWSYIGYWGDHQIIYLLKFLEFNEKYYPRQLEKYFNRDVFVYANVPYVIKEYAAILKNPKDTIVFNSNLDREIREKCAVLGADGALLQDKNGAIYNVNLIEKLLATLLAKCANLIPEAGIWMNTQRPEWNDANNALVGNGVSMVTLYYMRRFVKFFHGIIENSEIEKVEISKELHTFFDKIMQVFKDLTPFLTGSLNDIQRKNTVDALGIAASNFRTTIYAKGFSSQKKTLTKSKLINFLKSTLAVLEHTISANKRKDNLYHAYNLMTVKNQENIGISHLSEMLEGQVAVLSSGYLSSQESLQVLDGLKNSKLFRRDQYSYLLYPNKQLPKFIEKNIIPDTVVLNSKLLTTLLNENNLQIIEQDVTGAYHFNGNFNNADSLDNALNILDDRYQSMVYGERESLLEAFENIFHHKAFTGRSGTFFGYEGLGSIYWHMVSKLLVAVQECCQRAVVQKEDTKTIGRLLEHYYEINAGIGVHKSPMLYGAFPTDPYSHTPAGKGAQQPGMTGQVKEDILSRFGELGVSVEDGCLHFNPFLLLRQEFLDEKTNFEFVNVSGNSETIKLRKGELCFTCCQVPIVYQLSDSERIQLIFADGTKQDVLHRSLSKEHSRLIFERKGEISSIYVSIIK